jgi:hypothetical protein
LDEVNSKRSSRKHVHILLVLFKEIGDLATEEKDMYNPVLKKWHPLATGVVVATLPNCFRNEFEKFIVGLRDLTSDAAQVLKAAGKLEKDPVHFASEDS